MDRSRVWPETENLVRLTAAWRARFSGCDLHRVAAGPGWVRLHLAGEARDSLLFCGLPAARLVCAHTGRLPDPVAAALPHARQHPLNNLLAGARFVSCGLLPDDRVVAIHLARTNGPDVVLLHRLFGARANTTLVDKNHQLLWSVHRPPHQTMAAWPPDSTWSRGQDQPPPDDHDAQAMLRLARACGNQIAASATALLNRTRKTNARLLGNLDHDLANADQSAVFRAKAEALAANLYQQPAGIAAIELANLTTGAPLSIALDPARTPAQNLAKWFQRARKAEKGLEIIAARREEAAATGQQLAAAASQLETIQSEAVEPLERLAALQKWRAAHENLLPQSTPGRRTQQADEPARPFRRYRIDGTWDVWLGRSSQENDVLTHRTAHQRDIWFHAQGVPGSHAILRTAGHPERVPRQVVEKAAALAALHSKARNSSLVPVVFTEKRYVRKPRKSPAGTAVCLRDESLFVKPGLRPGVEPA